MTLVLRRTVAWLLPMMVLGSTSREAWANCVSELAIAGKRTDTGPLRRRLEASDKLESVPLENCRTSRILLRPAASGWSLEFRQGRVHVTRHVQSLDVAAMWIESWLLPPAEPTREAADDQPSRSGSPGAAAPSAVVVDAAARAEPGRGADTVGRDPGAALEAGSTLRVAPEGALWLGPEIRWHAGVSGAWWLEPHGGIAWPVSNGPTGDARSFRVGTSVGRVVYHSERFALSSYADVGATTLLWRDEDSGKDLAGPGLGVGLLLACRLAAALRLVARTEVATALAEGSEFEQVTYDHGGDGEKTKTIVSDRSLEPMVAGVFGIGLQLALGGKP